MRGQTPQVLKVTEANKYHNSCHIHSPIATSFGLVENIVYRISENRSQHQDKAQASSLCTKVRSLTKEEKTTPATDKSKGTFEANLSFP